MIAKELSKISSNNNKSIKLSLLSEVTKDSFTENFHNTFIVFNSINDILYLVYSNFKKHIICLNLKNNEKICEIKNNSFISSYNHYLDVVNKRDILMTISIQNKEIKIWDMKNIECIFKLSIEGSFFSGCFLKDNNNLYLVANSSNFEHNLGEVNIYDFHNNKIKKINDCNEPFHMVYVFYDKKQFKNFIISTHYKYIKSYDYEKNKLYFKYEDGGISHFSSEIYEYDEDIIKLIDSCWTGDIRIWNFHTGELLNKIEIKYGTIREICILDKDYLVLGCDTFDIKLLDINNKIIIQSLKVCEDWILTIKKFTHPQYGKCLILQGNEKNQIKMFIIENC